jgi:hypothetical protein
MLYFMPILSFLHRSKGTPDLLDRSQHCHRVRSLQHVRQHFRVHPGCLFLGKKYLKWPLHQPSRLLVLECSLQHPLRPGDHHTPDSSVEVTVNTTQAKIRINHDFHHGRLVSRLLT